MYEVHFVWVITIYCTVIYGVYGKILKVQQQWTSTAHQTAHNKYINHWYIPV